MTRDVVAAEVFGNSEGGVTVLVDEAIDDIRMGSPVQVEFTRPNGSAADLAATYTVVRWRRGTQVARERVQLIVKGTSREELPSGTRIGIVS